MNTMIRTWAKHAEELKKAAADVPLGNPDKFEELTAKAEACEHAGKRVFDYEVEMRR